MTTNDLMRNTALTATIAAMGLLAAGMGVFLLTTDSTKALAAVTGVFILAGLAMMVGNPRLFALWGVMFSIPFDLSKRFGPIIEKMGGESSFRVELYDPFLFVLLFFIARDLLLRNRESIHVPKVIWPWVIIMFFGVYMVIVGPWRTTAAHEVFRMAKVTLLFLVITNELTRPGRIVSCAAALMFGLIFQSGVGLYQYATKSHLGLDFVGETGSGTLDQLKRDSVRTIRAFRAGAFMNHPNIFGIYLGALLPMAVAGFLLRRSNLQKFFFLGAAMLGMAALITTMSRSGWLSGFCGMVLLLFLFIMHRGLSRQSMLTAILASAALMVVLMIFAEPIIVRITESKYSAMLSRSEYISDASGMIKARPVWGWGLNSYVYAAPPFTKYGARGAMEKYENWLPPVHNIYLLWWAETGIVGLSIHLLIVGWIIAIGIANMKVRNRALFAINAACLAAILALLVDGFFSFSLRINSILRLFWVIAALIFAIRIWRLQNSAATVTTAPDPVSDRPQTTQPLPTPELVWRQNPENRPASRWAREL